MKRLYSIKSSHLIQQYKNYGTSIERLIGGVDEFTLVEVENGLRIWEPVVLGDEQFYRELSENNSWYYLEDKTEYQAVLSYLEGLSVLEVGCGEGFFPEKYKISDYIGLELNGKAVEKAKKKGLHVVQEDFYSFAQMHPGTRDSVCSFQVLEHLPDPGNFFSSAHKVLKQDGILVTAVPSENSFCGVFKSNCLNCPPHHITKWTDSCLKSYPEQFGFECVDLIHIPVEEMHYELFLHKFTDAVFFGNTVFDSNKIGAKIIRNLLRLLFKGKVVPSEFNIPGHTVVSVHRKSVEPQPRSQDES